MIPHNAYRCPVHAGQLHGGEAAELRGALEQMITDGAVSARALRRLLDRVDARDSLAHEEIKAKVEQAARGELMPILLACEAIPDITISKWACDPGQHWNAVRAALRAQRLAQGLDVDAYDPQAAFDEHGWLVARRGQPGGVGP